MIYAGEEKCILVDTLNGVTPAREAKQEFEKITDKPIRTIIYTQYFHFDHTSGASVFAGPDTRLIGRKPTYPQYGRTGMIKNICGVRGARQFGVGLSPEENICVGIGPRNEINGEKGSLPCSQIKRSHAGCGKKAEGSGMIDNTFTLISRLDGEIRRFITEELAREGLTNIVPSHGAIIMELMKHGQVTMNEVARLIGRTPQTVTSLVKKLVKDGYVETRKSPGDSRVTEASLTDKGRILAATLLGISEKNYEIQYDGLSEDEITILRNGLIRMYENFAGNKQYEP